MIYEVFHFKPDKESSLASLTPEPPTCRVHATYVSCEKRDAARLYIVSLRGFVRRLFTKEILLTLLRAASVRHGGSPAL